MINTVLFKKLLFLFIVIQVNLSWMPQVHAMETKEEDYKFAKLKLPGLNFLRLILSERELLIILCNSLFSDHDDHLARIEKIANSWMQRLQILEILPPDVGYKILLSEHDNSFFIDYGFQEKNSFNAWKNKNINNTLHNVAKIEIIKNMGYVEQDSSNLDTVEITLIDQIYDLNSAKSLLDIIDKHKASLDGLSEKLISENMLKEISRVVGPDAYVASTQARKIMETRLKREEVFLQILTKKVQDRLKFQELEFFDDYSKASRVLRIVDRSEQHQAAAKAFDELITNDNNEAPDVLPIKKNNKKKKKKAAKQDKAPVKAEEQGPQPKKFNAKSQQKAKDQQAKKNIRKQQNKKAKLAMTDVLKELLERARVSELKARVHKQLLKKSKRKEQLLWQSMHKALPHYKWFTDNKTKLDPILFAGLIYDLREGLSAYQAQAQAIDSVQEDLALLNSYVAKNSHMYVMRSQIKSIIDQGNIFEDKSIDDSYELLQDRYKKIAQIKENFLDTYLFLAKTTLGDDYLNQIKDMESGISVLAMDKNSYELFVDELHQVISKIAADLTEPNEYSAIHFIGSSTTFFSLHPNKGNIADIVFDRDALLNNTENYLAALKDIKFFDSVNFADRSDIDVKIFSPGLLKYFNRILGLGGKKLSEEFLWVNNNPAVHRMKDYLETETRNNMHIANVKFKLAPLRDFIAAWEKKLDRKIEINLAKGQEPLRRQSQFGEKAYTDGGGQRSLAEIMQQVSGPFVSTKSY